jgi:hypothetical protein
MTCSNCGWTGHNKRTCKHTFPHPNLVRSWNSSVPVTRHPGSVRFLGQSFIPCSLKEPNLQLKLTSYERKLASDPKAQEIIKKSIESRLPRIDAK